MHKEQDPFYKKFLSSIAGVILLASPSQGSSLGTIAAPLMQGLASLTGGMSTLLNWQHLAALKPNSPELVEITNDFDQYCVWFDTTMNRKLPVHALVETVGVGMPRFRLDVMVRHG